LSKGIVQAKGMCWFSIRTVTDLDLLTRYTVKVEQGNELIAVCQNAEVAMSGGGWLVGAQVRLVWPVGANQRLDHNA